MMEVYIDQFAPWKPNSLAGELSGYHFDNYDKKLEYFINVSEVFDTIETIIDNHRVWEDDFRIYDYYKLSGWDKFYFDVDWGAICGILDNS